MPQADLQPLRYKRSRFSTRLPRERKYTAGHMWLRAEGRGARSYQVGFTQFALRMLGDPVEFEFELRSGDAVEMGQVVGWVEGFKAVTDVYAPLTGMFGGPNSELEDNIELLRSAPYSNGWLFHMTGEPDPDCVDAQGYAAILDATVDRMLGERS